MSDSESQSTIEDISFSRILEILGSAAEDCLASKDYLSYSTVLDIYLGQPARYSFTEREVLLQKLIDIFAKYPDIVNEIGWDLPHLLLKYVDLDFDFEGGIRSAPCVYKIIKLFEILALSGNHKELLLKSCETLSCLKVSDLSCVTSDQYVQEKFFDLKLYCIIELIDSCLRQIQTQYPSRFLSMPITAFCNAIYMNIPTNNTNTVFMAKRVYSFAKNYEPAVSEGSEVSPEELLLVRKLLSSFISCAIELLFKESVGGFCVHIVSRLQRNQRHLLPKYFDYTVDNDILTRMVSLAESYDMDLKENFDSYLADSNRLIKSVDYTQPKSDEEDISGILFEKILVDYQKNLANLLVSSSQKIVDSTQGLLILYTYHLCSEGASEPVEVLFKDVVAATLRSVIPGMVKATFINRGIHDVLGYWGWYVTNNKAPAVLEAEIASMPPVLLKLYCQAMLFMVISSINYPTFRYLLITLLTKILTLTPENMAYDFLKDSLENCPYDNLRVALGGVLKELLTKDRPSAGKDLEDKLLEMKLSDETAAKAQSNGTVAASTAAPPLPPRKYINLTKERVDDIFNIIEASNEATFIPTDTGIDVDIPKLTTLSASLNLLVLIHANPLVNQERLIVLTELVLESIGKVKAQKEADAVKINAVEILSIALERMSKQQ